MSYKKTLSTKISDHFNKVKLEEAFRKIYEESTECKRIFSEKTDTDKTIDGFLKIQCDPGYLNRSYFTFLEEHMGTENQERIKKMKEKFCFSFFYRYLFIEDERLNMKSRDYDDKLMISVKNKYFFEAFDTIYGILKENEGFSKRSKCDNKFIKSNLAKKLNDTIGKKKQQIQTKTYCCGIFRKKTIKNQQEYNKLVYLESRYKLLREQLKGDMQFIIYIKNDVKNTDIIKVCAELYNSLSKIDKNVFGKIEERYHSVGQQECIGMGIRFDGEYSENGYSKKSTYKKYYKDIENKINSVKGEKIIDEKTPLLKP